MISTQALWDRIVWKMNAKYRDAPNLGQGTSEIEDGDVEELATALRETAAAMRGRGFVQLSDAESAALLPEPNEDGASWVRRFAQGFDAYCGPGGAALASSLAVQLYGGEGDYGVYANCHAALAAARKKMDEEKFSDDARRDVEAYFAFWVPRCEYMHKTGADVVRGAGKERELPNFKGSDLGRFPLVSADFWTNRLLSSSSRSTAESLASKRSHMLTLKSG